MALRIMAIGLLALSMVSGLAPGVAMAQDGGSEPRSPTAANVAPEELAILVNPLTREELLTEADDRRDALRATAEEIARGLVELRRQTDPASDEAGALAQRIDALRNDRAALMQNLSIVVDALETKTRAEDSETLARISDYRLYMSAVARVRIDTSDFASAWGAVVGWIGSEQGGRRWGWNLLLFFGILAIARLIAALVRRLLRSAFDRVEWPELLEDFLVRSSFWIVMFVGFLVALSALEVSMGPLLAMVGAAGFIVAFAMQDSLSNFASGLLILFFRPFDTGDVVEAGGVSGKVESMNLVATTIKTFDNKRMVVPNNSVVSNVVTNATGVPERRVDLEFGIGYSDDIDHAHAVLEEIVSAHSMVLEEPAPVIRVHQLADSSVNFIARPWVKTEDYWNVYWDLTKEVKRRFDAEGIGIPYPQQDVHLHVVNESATQPPHEVRATADSNRPASSLELDGDDGQE